MIEPSYLATPTPGLRARATLMHTCGRAMIYLSLAVFAAAQLTGVLTWLFTLPAPLFFCLLAGSAVTWLVGRFLGWAAQRTWKRGIAHAEEEAVRQVTAHLWKEQVQKKEDASNALDNLRQKKPLGTKEIREKKEALVNCLVPEGHELYSKMIDKPADWLIGIAQKLLASTAR